MAAVKLLYRTHFDSRKYADLFLTGEFYHRKWVVEEFYHRIFTQGKLSGETLIEVGCGPGMRSVLTASGHVSEIYLADLLENNRELLTKWVDDEPDAYDFTQMFKYVANLEGKSDIKYLEERVRKCVKEIIFCDLLVDNPLSPRPPRQFDIVTSSYCLDEFPDYADHLTVWKSVGALIRPGGYAAVVNMLHCTYCKMEEQIYPMTYLDADLVKKAVNAAGFEILEYKEYLVEAPVFFSDCKGSFTVLVKKL